MRYPAQKNSALHLANAPEFKRLTRAEKCLVMVRISQNGARKFTVAVR